MLKGLSAGIKAEKPAGGGRGPPRVRMPKAFFSVLPGKESILSAREGVSLRAFPPILLISI